VRGRAGTGEEVRLRKGKDTGKERAENGTGEPYRYFEARGSVSFNLMFSVVYANNFSA